MTDGPTGTLEHRRVGDLMTRAVVSVRDTTPFKEVVRALADHGVSAVPVTDAHGGLLGVISEADLLTRTARRAEREQRALIRPEPSAAAEGEAADDDEGAMLAEDVMTAPAVCAGPDWSVAQAAKLMVQQQVKRLPVVDEADRLIGIVSRSDLLRVFLRPDRALAEEIRRDILERTLHLVPSDVAVEVREGRVTLTGTVPDHRFLTILRRLCASVDGVVAVDDRVTVPERPPLVESETPSWTT
ncbi:hypothetical protein SLNWT_3260 [Streptomyces albus]|uniref:CBS domain-containing protein n=1 Tax=Streptomyces albus (strain ATCC 21838 / DSM 41398 / FERM P-419 / JCM 4703 / NBRC 107858) TaxID=1081613 RepID=A0A0B5EYC7_STRA4|nr:hypothetical protein SLNWT_3260 [Streptomyces albus]AOU77944.1 hypothetical protein SLNHY_3253 [Streptomyces albus]